MTFLENKVPPPIVMLISIFAMWLITDSASDLPLFRPSAFAGVVLAVAGILLAVSGVREFKRASTTINPLAPDSASNLVISGIFSYSRNPMYLGMLLVLLGNGLYLENPWCALVILAFMAFMIRFQIVPEERAMQLLFGESFAEYRSKVRRWL